MTIITIPSGPFATNAYLVTDPATKLTAIIDPAPESAAAIQKHIQDKALIPDKILLTHSHWDHIADVAVLKDKYQVPVFIHGEDAENLKNPGADLLPCWIEIRGVNPEHLITDTEKIILGELSFEVIFTPGHTPGGVCYYCEKEALLFSGDTLFQGTIGNLSFPTARPKLMWEALKRLAKLPPETKVFPGHGPCTTIGTEMKLLLNAEKIFG